MQHVSFAVKGLLLNYVAFVCDQEGMEHPWCDLIYLTDIMAEFECDVFFPEFDRQLFKVQDRYVQNSLNGSLQMVTCSVTNMNHRRSERHPLIFRSRGILQPGF